MNLPGNRWLNDLSTVEGLTSDLEKAGPLCLVRCLVGERRFRPSGPPLHEYNVAAHSLLVGLVFLRLRKLPKYNHWPLQWAGFAFCHDLHEAVLGDIVRPVKDMIGGNGITRAADRLDAAILEGLLGLSPVDAGAAHEAVKVCDNTALLLEAAEWDIPLHSGRNALWEFAKNAEFCGADPKRLVKILTEPEEGDP